MGDHISDHDLERYYLGMVTGEGELAALEEHYLGCPDCARRAEETQDYVDLVQDSLTSVNDPYSEPMPPIRIRQRKS